MSSHHFIREGQEPALLIMDAHASSFEEVQQLLEWSPTVIVSEQVLEEVLLWGIKIDVVIAEASNISILTESLHDQFPLKLISCNNSQEALATALYFLIASKQKAVNILSTESLNFFERFSSLDISVFQSGKRWSFIRDGVFEKWLPAGSTIRVSPIDHQSELKTDHDGVITIRKEAGFWVAED